LTKARGELYPSLKILNFLKNMPQNLN